MADAEAGTLLGSGRNADVYDIGGGRVLRRYRDGRDARAVAVEAKVMARARAAGVPVPEVFDVSGADIVMARATGPTMLEALGRQPLTVHDQAQLLARMHALVHAVPADVAGLRRPFGTESAESHVLLHGDLHPQNVILTGNGPVIIDWEGAAAGPAIADVAMTWVLVAFSEVPATGPEAAGVRGIRGKFLDSFLRAAGPIDEGWQRTLVRFRVADPSVLPAEAARMERWLLER
jgi:aminoglycoside phosphotransferase (APT) family kinase protein